MKNHKLIHRKESQQKTIAQRKENGSGQGFYLKDNRPESVIQQKMIDAMNASHLNQPIQKKENNTGLPDNLKTGIENLSGHSMDNVKVHYNSSKPAQLNAHAYAQGTNIHLASGQEKHLPHEAWHVVQQKQGRVQPTTQLKEKININDDKELEKEADIKGKEAIQAKSRVTNAKHNTNQNNTIQRIAIDVPREQTLLEDAHDGDKAGVKFEWRSKFDVNVVESKIIVTIKILSSINADQFQSVWAKQVYDKWSNRFAIKVGDKSYPIEVKLVQVGKLSDAHYEVEAKDGRSALHSDGRGHFGTSSMTEWGQHDSMDVAHEVGHMLGNPDEYGKVKIGDGDVRDYTKEPSKNIMGVTSENPIAKHYYLIKWAVDRELGVSPETSEVIPDLASRIGKEKSGAPDLSTILSTRKSLRKTTKPDEQVASSSADVEESKQEDKSSQIANEFIDVGMEIIKANDNKKLTIDKTKLVELKNKFLDLYGELIDKTNWEEFFGNVKAAYNEYNKRLK